MGLAAGDFAGDLLLRLLERRAGDATTATAGSGSVSGTESALSGAAAAAEAGLRPFGLGLAFAARFRFAGM